MYRRHSDLDFWHLVPAKPGADANVRRWNAVIITILAALVLGLFLAAL